MGFFENRFNKWAESKQRKELKAFLSNLQAMDSTEIGFVVAGATHVRHQLEANGHNLLDPIAYLVFVPEFPHVLSTTIIKLQKQNQLADAAGYMIWLHTFRAANRLELRNLGRMMWKELARGFPHVTKSANGFRTISGIDLDIRGATTFPEGLSPERK